MPNTRERANAMKTYLLITGNGSLLIVTSYPSIDSPGLVTKLAAKGIEKFLYYELPETMVSALYGEHYKVTVRDLAKVEDKRVIDYNGDRVFKRVNLAELGSPKLFERSGVSGHGSVYG